MVRDCHRHADCGGASGLLLTKSFGHLETLGHGSWLLKFDVVLASTPLLASGMQTDAGTTKIGMPAAIYFQTVGIQFDVEA